MTFRLESMLLLSPVQVAALSAWPMVRRGKPMAWTTDMKQWAALSGSPPVALSRLLAVMQAGGFLQDENGELVPDVVSFLRRELVNRISPPKRSKKP